MKKKEFVKALHRQTEGIHVSSELRRRTLELIEQKEEKIVKKKLSVSVIAVALVLLLGAVALAATSRVGLVDYYKQMFGREIPENATQNIQNDVATSANDLVSVSVRELYYDGMTAMAVVDVTPQSEHMLLIGVDNTMDDHCVNLFRNNEREGVTIRDYFLEQEYKAAYRVRVGVVGSEGEGDESIDFRLNEDGVMSYYCQTSFTKPLPEREAQLSLTIYQCADEEGNDIEEITAEQIIHLTQPLALSAGAQQENKLYISTQPQKIEDAGIEIEQMRVLTTDLELKVEVDYSYPEPEEGEQLFGLTLEVIDPESTETEPYLQRLKEGVDMSAHTDLLEEGEGRSRYTYSFTLSVDELHESYTLRAFDPMEKTRFGTATMTMREATVEETAAFTQAQPEDSVAIAG